MKIRVIHWLGQQPPLPEAVKVVEENEWDAAQWEIEIRDLDHLLGLSQFGSLAIIHPELQPTPGGRQADKREFGAPFLLVDSPGRRFQHR